MAKKKKKATAAQLRNLAKGRAKRKKNLALKGSRTVVKKKSTKKPIKKKVVTVAKKKRSTPKKTAKKYARSARSFVKKSGAIEMLTRASYAIVGGVASGFIVSKVPIADGRIRSALPILAGIILAGAVGQKNEIAKSVASGMVILGSVSLFKQLAPGVPMLAGDRVIMLPYNQEKQMGVKVRLGNNENEELGIPVRLGQYRKYKTSA